MLINNFNIWIYCKYLWTMAPRTSDPLVWKFTGSKVYVTWPKTKLFCCSFFLLNLASIHVLFLAHLSQRLKWALLITICPFSVVVVVVVVNFSYFLLLLQNHWANFNQTWHKAFMGKGDSSWFKWRAMPLSKGRWQWNSKITVTNFKTLLKNHWTNLTKLGTKHPLVKGIQVCSNEGPGPFPRGDNYEIVKIHLRN